MKHWAAKTFWEHYERLPEQKRSKADHRFELLKIDERDQTVQLKQVDKDRGLYSARAGYGTRALACKVSGGLLWFWIGSHDEYDRRLAKRIGISA